MRKAACLAAAATLLLVPGAWAGIGGAKVRLSSNRAGARPVAVRVTFGAELQCGRLPWRAILLRLPAQERVPTHIAAADVLVGGAHASRVTVSKRTLAIGIPHPAGMVCDSIRPGQATILITRAAGLGNPGAPGRYAFVVRHGAETATAWVTIR
ncbi:MAG TPA: hypothetical protein VLU96_00170 [Gaiellaceae bacterium]|nr:hypothetical protein [Gaiellaceae bacterium]